MTRASEPAESGEPDAPHDAPATDADGAAPAMPRRTIGLAVIIVGLLVAVLPGTDLWVTLAGLSIALAGGVPLALADAPDVARKAVPVAVVLASVIAGWAAYSSATSSGVIRYRTHDGGVIITRAAADDLAHGRNPYVVDHTRQLPPSWKLVQGSDHAKVANPVGQHYPYLPAFALANSPFVVAANALGTTWDPRILGWIALVGALVALARRPEPAWLRLGAVLGLGGPFTVVYLAWGTNDLFAVGLVVLALCWAERRPRLAGVALALALSAKVLLLVLVPALAMVVLAGGGWAALKRWWTTPAVLAVTCLPLFAWNPKAFLDDTVWFNLGKTKPLMPTSGLGLPAVASSTFHGPLLAVVTLLGLVVALAFPIWAVRRWPSVWVAGAAAGVALLGVLIPARTFQTNYLVLVVSLLPLAWLALGDEPAVRPRSAVPGDASSNR